MGFFAQKDCNISIEGQVVDRHNEEVLSFATVQIKDLAISVVADSIGYYKIDGLCEGKYLIECAHVGCEPIFLQVQIKGDTSLYFYPEHHAEFLTEIEIIENKKKHTAQLIERMAPKEIESNQSLPVAQILEKSGKIQTFNTGNSISKPVVHGMHSQRLLFYQQGVRQEGQNWGVEHAPEIDAHVIDELSFIKGAGVVRYSSAAMGGVILSETHISRTSPGLGAEVFLNTQSNGRAAGIGVNLEGMLKHIESLRFKAGGSFQKAGNRQAPDYVLSNTSFDQKNAFALLDYRKKNFFIKAYYSLFQTNLGVFSGAHIGNLTDLLIAYQADRPIDSVGFTYGIGNPKQDVLHELFSLHSRIDLGQKGTFEISFSRQYNGRKEFDEHGPLSNLNEKDPELELRLTTHQANLIYAHLSEKKIIEGQLGLSVQKQKNTFSGRYFVPNYSSVGYAFFASEHLHLDKWVFEAGVRVETHTINAFVPKANVLTKIPLDFSNVSMHAGISKVFTDQASVRLNYARAWRPPSINELFSDGLHHGAAALEIGDSRLETEIAHQFTSEFLYTKDKWMFTVQPFVYFFDGYIGLVPQEEPALTIHGAFPVFNFQQFNARFYGSDISFEAQIHKRVGYSFHYNYLHAQDITRERAISNIPSNRISNRLELELSKEKSPDKWALFAQVLYVFEQNRVPSNTEFVDPPPAYTLLSAGASGVFSVKKTPISAYLQIDNLLDHSYRDYMNRFRYFADDLGRNIRLSIKIPLNFE